MPPGPPLATAKESFETVPLARLADRIGQTLATAWLPILACGLLTGLFGAYRIHDEPRLYNSSAEILVHPAGSSNLTLVYSGTITKPTLNIATEAYILKSDAVQSRVAMQLDLANDPRFWPYASSGHHLDFGKPSVRAAVLSQLRARLPIHYSDTSSDDEDDDSTEDKSEKARKRLKSSPDSGILRLSYVGSDPALGAQIVNAGISAYEAFSFERRRDTTARIAAALQSSLDEFRRNVQIEESDLLKLERSHGRPRLPHSPDPDVATLTLLRRAAASSQARLREDNAERKVAAALSTSSDDPDVFSANATLDSLRSALEHSHAQLAELGATVGPNHPEFTAVQARAEELRRQIEQTDARLRQMREERYAVMEMQARRVDAAVRSQTEAMQRTQDALVEAATLEVKLRRDSELYYILVNNVRTAAVDSGYGTTTFQVLKAADAFGQVLPRRYPQRCAPYVLGGLTAGFAIAFGVIFVPNARVRSVRRLEHALNMVCLGEVPWPREAGRPAPPPVLGSDSPAWPAAERLGGDLLLTPVAGKARRILFAATEERSRETSALVRMVASAVAGSGSRVLLIDDGGRSSGSAKCSLASVLRGDASLREAVIALPGPGSLHLLSGDHGTASMDPFLRQAEANYDCILVVAQGAPDRTRHEAILAWAHVGVLLVWRGRSKSRDLLQARNLFHEFSTGLTGFIRMV